MSKLNLLSATILAMGVASPLASAQTADPAPDASEAAPIARVIVTAQKREQDVSDVPINISVASQDTLDRLNTDDIEEYANFVPGLQVQSQSLNQPSYSLRGVTSDGGRPRVAVFQNGVAIANPDYGANLAMFDLERIEVVKGPQATLFGQGALVGGINFIQNRASLAGNEGWLKYDAGDYQYLRAEAGYNKVISDTLAVRVAGLKKIRDGYVDNLANSPDLMGEDTEALRAAIQWRPDPQLRADVFINYQSDASTGTEFKSMLFAPTGGNLDPFTAAASNINGDQLRDQLGADRQVLSTTANIAWEINDTWTLTSLTDYRDLAVKEAVDSDGAAFDLLQFSGTDRAQIWSQELRFNYDDGGAITGFFGANYSHLDSSNRLRLSGDEARAQALLAPQIAAGAHLTVPVVKQLLVLLGGLSPTDANRFDSIVDPLRISAALLLTQGIVVPLTGTHLEEQDSNEDQTSYDIFGDVTWKATDKFSLTGGLRYTKEELASDSLAYLLRGSPYLGGTRNAITGGTTLIAVDTPRSASFDTDSALTWRFNAAYRINDDLNTWLAIGRGRRPEALTPEGAGYGVVSEEIFDNVETGLYGEFLDRRLRVSTSAYYGEYKDFQTSNFDIVQGAFVTTNSGNATQYGLELDTHFVLTNTFRLFGSYAYNNSTYDQTDSNGNALEYAGNQFRLSPLNSASIGADIRWPVSDAGEVFLVPTYVWKDDVFFEDDNDPWEFQKAYGLLGLKLGYDHGGGRWGVSLYVENALDQDYLIDAGNTGGTFGIPTTTRGVPRMAGAAAYAKF